MTLPANSQYDVFDEKDLRFVFSIMQLCQLFYQSDQRLDGLEGKERVEEANWKKRVREKRDAQRTKNPTGAGEEELEDDALVPRNAIKLRTYNIYHVHSAAIFRACDWSRMPGSVDWESNTGPVYHTLSL